MNATDSLHLARRRTLVVTLVLLLVLTALAVPALSRTNVTWDEALGDLFFGERYYSFFTTLDARYLDFKADPYPPERVPDLAASPFRGRPWEYYPVANTLAAASLELFSRRLGWLDPFDAFHAVNIAFALTFLAVFVPILARRCGLAAATASALLLLTAPRVAGDLLANTKDFPEMVLFALALLAFLAAFERGSATGLLGAGVLWGLALGTKANALFVPAIVVAFLAWERGGESWRGRKVRLVAAVAAAAGCGLALFVLAWPYLWDAPVLRLLEHARYLLQRGDALRAESALSPLAAIAWTTPLPFLFALAAGIAPVAKAAARGDRLARLLVVWIGVVLLRLHLPGAVNFDGVRHFLELFPALAAVAGMGLSWAASRLAEAVRPGLSRVARGAILVVPLAAQGAGLVACHPFEIASWNELVGGLGGAQRRGLPQAGDYWALSYRSGLAWLNAQAPPGAFVAVPIAEHAVRLVAPVRLRPDVRLLRLTSPGRPEIPEPLLERLRELAHREVVFVMTVRRDDWDNVLTRECRARLRPEVEWSLQGGTVLSIYRYPG